MAVVLKQAYPSENKPQKLGKATVKNEITTATEDKESTFTGAWRKKVENLNTAAIT